MAVAEPRPAGSASSSNSMTSQKLSGKNPDSKARKRGLARAGEIQNGASKREISSLAGAVNGRAARCQELPRAKHELRTSAPGHPGAMRYEHV